MKQIAMFFFAISLFSCANKPVKTEKISVIKITKDLKKLAGDFKFTEGPTVDTAGNVYFTDLVTEVIYIWTVNNQLKVFRKNSNRANGLFFDKDQNLWVCEGGTGQITVTNPEGSTQSIATVYQNKRFNQPNDLWPDKKGGVYFSDPKYGKDDKVLTQDGMHVYYIKPEHNNVIRVCNDLEKPNGVLGTPDGKTLYITDSQGGNTYKYKIEPDGTLTNKTLFVAFGCDGMTQDEQGNMYFAPIGKKQVLIYSAKGEFLKAIQLPELPSNMCFGGKKRNQLFITARSSIYSVELNTKGVD